MITTFKRTEKLQKFLNKLHTMLLLGGDEYRKICAFLYAYCMVVIALKGIVVKCTTAFFYIGTTS